ncbi:MAG: hypothetical protein R3E50_17710 [Halioglobus sp.]
MHGDAVLRNDIAIGSNGLTRAKRVSDETTLLGDFRISGINPRSRYHLFLALDYPTLDIAQQALQDGRISPEEYVAVSNAWLVGGSRCRKIPGWAATWESTAWLMASTDSWYSELDQRLHRRHQ